MLLIKNVALLTPDQQIEDVPVLVENGRFAHIAPTNQPHPPKRP